MRNIFLVDSVSLYSVYPCFCFAFMERGRHIFPCFCLFYSVFLRSFAGYTLYSSNTTFLLFVFKKSPSEKVKNLFTWMSTAQLWWLKVHHWWREVHRWWRKVNPWWRKVHSWWRKVHFLAFCGVKYMVAECSIVYEWINIRRVDAEEERES